MRNNVSKVKNKHLIFKTSIEGVKPCLLVDNESKVEFIDKFFVHTNKIPSFKLEKAINFIFKNDKIVQKLTKKALVNVIIEDYTKQIICYLAELDVYIIILGNK